MTDVRVARFTGRDGLQPAYREIGNGRPLVLLHGFAGAGPQWLEHGPGAALAEAGGRRLILPDLRGHGESPRSADPAHFPPDVLVDDALALIEALGLEDGAYDLAGYSLGARVALRALVRGARPARAVLAGQGLAQVCGPQQRSSNHRLLTALVRGEPIEPGSPDAEAAYWLTTRSGADPRVLLHVLDSLVPTPREALRRVQTPVLVVVGDADHGHASADELAAALPDARFARVPGDHWFALGAPEFAQAMAGFLPA
jgi:pimeloyl-ACP methyl ester carboxylesterase